jgi:hypothetical protein
MACLVLQLPYQYLPIFQRLGADEATLKKAASEPPAPKGDEPRAPE